MKFEPSTQERSRGKAHAGNGPSDLNSPALGLSGSRWEVGRLEALRVTLLDRLPLSRLFPSEYWPSEDHPGKYFALEPQLRSGLIFLTVYKDLISDFLKASEADLKEFTVKRSGFRANPFLQAFLRIAEAITIRPAHVPGTVGHARQPSTASDLSSSSNEDKSEEPSNRHCVHC